MIEYEEALRLVLEHATGRGTERVPTAQACGHVLAEDVVARISSPPFNKAAMDGFAVRKEDVGELPVELDVGGEVFAGERPDFRVGPGQAARIMTGAPVPEGADTVVMIEHTESAGDSRVLVKQYSGGNVCAEGEDVRVGQTVLVAGTVLTALRIGVAAAAGHGELGVYRRPAAALLCTGNELVEPGATPRRGQIFDANGPMLSSLIGPHCRQLSHLGIVTDRQEQLEIRIRQGLDADVLVISGGVSMGDYDLVPAALKRAGVRPVFHKVAMKPGKPTFFGVAGQTLVFGMPGNPQSCFVVFHMLVAPALAAVQGAPELPPSFEQGTVAEGFDNKPGRMNVTPCTVDRQEGAALIRRCAYHGSADIVGPSAADAYFVVPRGVERVHTGQKVRFFCI